MGKNPAIKFYPDNWFGGTRFMTWEEKGRYIDLIMLQAQVYPRHIPAETFNDWGNGSVEILSKFLIDDDGGYYNERAKLESEKSHSASERGRNAVNQRKDRINTNDDTNVNTIVDTNVSTNDATFNNLNNDNINNNYLINNNSSVKETENNNNTSVDKSSKSTKSLKSPIVANWKTSFEIYLASATEAYNALRSDADWIAKQQRYNPNLNILLSLEKAFCEYWGTEAGWMHRKTKKKTEAINWKATYTNALSMRSNQVWQDNPKKPLTYQEDVLLRRARGEDI